MSDGVLNDTDTIVVSVHPGPATPVSPPPFDSNAQTTDLQGSIQEVGSNYIVVAGFKIWITSSTVKKFEDGQGNVFLVGQGVELKGSINSDGSISASKIQIGG